jgi:dihydroxyacetone kinase
MTGNQTLLKVLGSAAAALAEATEELNQLDGFAGDGDLGITMRTASGAVCEVLADSSERSVPELLSACGAALAKKAPSTSGTLVATGFLRAAAALRELSGDPLDLVIAALEAANAGIQARGKAAVGDRTLVDALDAACVSLGQARSEGLGLAAAMDAAAQACEAATAATASMQPKVGRSSWVPDRAKGHPDAGCQMVTIAFQAAARALSGSPGADRPA